MSRIVACLVGIACISGAPAAEVSGTITLAKKFRKQVLAPAVYDLRGVAIRESAVPDSRRNEFERIAVWLESDEPATVGPVHAAMEQRDRRMEPGLVIVPTGSTVDFPNLDPIFHNIFSLSRTQSFDLGYYPQGQSRSVRFQRPGIVQVYCHVHPNMYGVIVVVSSRWFQKPAPDGTFSLSGVTAGKYRLRLWQKTAGLVSKSIVVPESGTVRANFSIPDEDPEN